MSMWTTREDPKKLVRIAGVWVDPVAVVAVRDTQTGVRVFLSSGSEFDIERSSSTGSVAYNLDATKFVKSLTKAARDAE